MSTFISERRRRLDHPRLRARTVCCLCHQFKETGLVVCWPCFGLNSMRNGNPEIEAVLDDHEEELELFAQYQEEGP